MNRRYYWLEVLCHKKLVSLRSWYHYPVTDPMIRWRIATNCPKWIAATRLLHMSTRAQSSNCIST